MSNFSHSPVSCHAASHSSHLYNHALVPPAHFSLSSISALMDHLILHPAGQALACFLSCTFPPPPPTYTSCHPSTYALPIHPPPSHLYPPPQDTLCAPKPKRKGWMQLAWMLRLLLLIISLPGVAPHLFPELNFRLGRRWPLGNRKPLIGFLEKGISSPLPLHEDFIL